MLFLDGKVLIPWAKQPLFPSFPDIIPYYSME
jgi:hypothetical protein